MDLCAFAIMTFYFRAPRMTDNIGTGRQPFLTCHHTARRGFLSKTRDTGLKVLEQHILFPQDSGFRHTPRTKAQSTSALDFRMLDLTETIKKPVQRLSKAETTIRECYMFISRTCSRGGRIR